MPSGEKFCRKPPIQSSELSAPSSDSSLFKPELPPVETAVMRALVGSEGSTGSVPGTRYAMLAKLRAGSGKPSRSWLSTTPPRTAFVVFKVSIVIEEGLPCTLTVSCAACGLSVMVMSRTSLTAVSTLDVASAKPLAETVTCKQTGRQAVDAKFSAIIGRSSVAKWRIRFRSTGRRSSRRPLGPRFDPGLHHASCWWRFVRAL